MGLKLNIWFGSKPKAFYNAALWIRIFGLGWMLLRQTGYSGCTAYDKRISNSIKSKSNFLKDTDKSHSRCCFGGGMTVGKQWRERSLQRRFTLTPDRRIACCTMLCQMKSPFHPPDLGVDLLTEGLLYKWQYIRTSPKGFSGMLSCPMTCDATHVFRTRLPSVGLMPLLRHVWGFISLTTTQLILFLFSFYLEHS